MTDHAELRPAETVSESVPTRHETPDVAELQRLAEACPMPDNDPNILSEWYELGDLTERNHPLPPIDAAFIAAASPAVVLGLLDRLAHMTEARDNARAEVERLTAIVNSDVLEATRSGVRIPRFDVPYPGGSTTADFMRTMAERLPSKGVMGSNCSNTAASILAAYADALDALDGESES